MANYTENYNLILPNKQDNYNVETANTNNTAIDNILHSKVDKKAGKDLSTNDFTDGYKKKIDSMQRLYKYKGSLDTYSQLETKIDNIVGDVWNILEDNNNYCWDGIQWVELGINIDLGEYATNNSVDEEINNINKDFSIHRYILTTTEEIEENTDYEIPCNYKVGQDTLDIYYMGERLIKGTHYLEIGENNSVSNTIQFYNWGQSVPIDRTIEFIVRGVYENET